MAVKRITAAAINAGEPYQDGDIVTGLMVNEVVKVLKDGVNYNKFFIDAMFSGTTEEAIVIGVPKGTLNDVEEDITHLENYIISLNSGFSVEDGKKAFIFRCLYGNEADPTEITGVVALNYYKYTTTTEEWVHQYPVSMDTFIKGLSSDFTNYPNIVEPSLGSVLVVQDDNVLNRVSLQNVKNVLGVTELIGVTVPTIEQDITEILDGTQTVKKAEQDASGNDITTTYETKADATSKKSEIDGRLNTAESDIDAVELRLDTAEGDIDTLQTEVQALETANMIKSYTYNPATHVLVFTYYDNTTTSFDLPLESAIVSASYDNTTKDITFVLQSGATLVVPLDDLVSGLASETWVNTYFIPKTALKTTFSGTPLDTNVISEKLAKDTFDTKEALANKAIDFSTVNDTKYPTTKAVSERLLNLPIAELNNHTLREVFETNQLLSNNQFDNNTSWTLMSGVTALFDNSEVTFQNVNTYTGIRQTISYINNHQYYYILRAKGDGTLQINTSNAGINQHTLTNIFSIYSFEFIKNPIWSNLFGLANVQINKTTTLDYVYLVDKTTLGIDILTVSQMDYWFNVYQALQVSDTNAIFSMIAQNKTALESGLALKANIAQEAWITPTLLNGWLVDGGLSYKKSTTGIVTIVGRITEGTANEAFAFPLGYRPIYTTGVPVTSYNKTTGVRTTKYAVIISSNGALEIINGGVNERIDICISYMAGA